MLGRVGDSHRFRVGDPDVDAALPGDDLVSDAGLVFDHGALLGAPPEAVWPWLVQLGKGRAGWYMPARVEPWLVWSRRRRAATRIDARWQGLAVGDRIPDYGGRDAEFEVAAIERPHALVYRSERHGARFSWALVLDEHGAASTRLHIRFRATVRSGGVKRAVLSGVGEVFDWATIALMLGGLRERVERG